MAVDPDAPRYARQRILSGFGRSAQQRLADAHVVVIGAGGLGSAVLPVLAAAGVGTIAIVDDDVVDASNLHRQTLFSPSDVGRAKVDAAEFLTAAGTFLAALASFISVALIVFNRDGQVVSSAFLLAVWLIGVTMQIVAGTIARMRR